MNSRRIFLCIIWCLCLLSIWRITIFCAPDQKIEQSTLSETPSAGETQEKISLDLKGIDILELFKILSAKMNVTIVPTKNVSGRINIFLNNLTFEDALDVILVSQNLACERKDNTITVMTDAEYTKLYGRSYNEKRKFESIKLSYAKPSAVFNALTQIKSDIGKVIADETSATLFLMDTPERLEIMENTVKELDKPPQTEVFDLRYAKPEDIKTQLSSVITPGAGELFVDSRSTKVVVSDLPEKLQKIKRIINAFDSESQQVLIETKIVELTLKDEFQHDINWERILPNLYKRINQLDTVGTFPVSSSFNPSPSLSTANLKVSIGTLASDNFTSAFRFLETLGSTKVISTPKIVALNNQEAKIMVGSREAYVIQSLSQASGSTISSENIQFIDVGVKLNVMPTIHKDGFISMRLKPEVSSVREIITTTLGSRVPIVDTSEVETTVKIKEGTMIMVAGLYKQDRRDDNSGTPTVLKVPFLKTGFGSRAALKKRTEFIVFLIPRLIGGDVSMGKKDMEGWVASGLLQEAGAISNIPETRKEPAINRSEINIGEKLKGLEKY
jgi:MSHA biogenesis protein MshL